MTFKQRCFIVFQYFIPQHWLSRLVGYLAACEIKWLKNTFIKLFIQKFGINMQEAARTQPEDYASFNDFFTRELAPDVRPIAENAKVVSPADGCVSQLGLIEHGRIFQAKGQDFSLAELLGGDSALATEFAEGSFNTIYLSPKDYHRVHMPVSGTLRKTIYVPGDLFSVNQTTAENVPRLFARNERLVAIFDTEHGPMAMVLVGAMIVAAIETVWAGRITPMLRKVKTTDFSQPQAISLKQGDEMGRFLLGSTVILCFGKGNIRWQDHLGANSELRVGDKLAE